MAVDGVDAAQRAFREEVVQHAKGAGIVPAGATLTYDAINLGTHGEPILLQQFGELNKSRASVTALEEAKQKTITKKAAAGWGVAAVGTGVVVGGAGVGLYEQKKWKKALRQQQAQDAAGS